MTIFSMDFIFSSAFISHLATALFSFFAGLITDRLWLSHIQSDRRIEIDLVALIKIGILVGMLMLYVLSLVSFQFFSGHEPSLIFSGLGAYSFGSLVGEKDLIIRIISAVSKKK